MTMIDDFNLDSIKFLVYDPGFHKLPNLRLKQSNGEDPLDIQNYYESVINGISPEIGLLYVIKYKTEIIGFFSISSAILEPCLSNSSSPIITESKKSVVRALLISKIGIDQKYRCFGLGKYILQYCVGFARNLKEKEEFDIVLFRTTKSLAQKIYCSKYNFKMIQGTEKLVWVYKKI